MGILILLIAAMLSGGVLFFEDQLSALTNILGFEKSINQIDQSGQVLRIAYLFQPQDLNPFSTDPAAQARLHDVYESLVSLDENLIVRPGLAVSYGLSNDTNWEIRLRSGVKFQDGSTLDTEDVLDSFKTAETVPNNSVADLLAGIDSITRIDDLILIIKTEKPDPLFLNKLAKMPILPSGFTDFAHPIGSGPYKLVQTDNLTDLIYQRNSNYWGDLPYFGNLEVKSIGNKNERIMALKDGTIDFLADVPPDAVSEFQESGFKVDFIPSLEIGFVMFNFMDRHFVDVNVRKAIAEAINKESFLDLAMGYAKTVNQFVSNGVFGYNPDLKGIAYNQKDAIDLISKNVSSFEKIKFAFYFPESLKLLGQYFQEQLKPIGIQLELKPLADLDLEDKIQNSQIPFYYLGWRNESGDALPFLKAVIHSKMKGGYGIYNAMNYSNPQVDQLIEKSETNLNQADRLEDIQNVMKIVSEDDVVGIPLFETQSLFAYRSDLIFRVRVDSLIYPSSIRKNNIRKK